MQVLSTICEHSRRQDNTAEGVRWDFHQHVRDVTPEEVMAAMESMGDGEGLPGRDTAALGRNKSRRSPRTGSSAVALLSGRSLLRTS